MRLTFRALAPALLTLVVVAGGAVPAPSAYAKGPTSVTLQGRGYGHGHGLSQYGAEGAARQGLSYRRIIGFYYPNTTWGTAGGSVSVLITGDTTDDVVVGARSGLTATSLRSGRTWRLTKAGARRWRLTPANGGADTRLSVLTDSWHVVRTMTGPAQFSAGGAPVTLFVPGGSRSYRGVLRSAGGVHRDTVNKLKLDAYLRGVVPREVFPSWHAAALRAQAVAARTYAAYERSHPTSSRFQMYDDTRDQAYGGVSSEVASTDAAVRGTAGEIRTYAGAAAFTQFSASNGGWTASGGQPYLVAQQDPYDRWSGNPYNSWTVDIPATTIENAYPGIGDFLGLTAIQHDGDGDWAGGRVASITIDGSTKDVTLTGDTFRSVFGLRSTWFAPA